MEGTTSAREDTIKVTSSEEAVKIRGTLEGRGKRFSIDPQELTSNNEEEDFLDAVDSNLEAGSDMEKLECQIQNVILSIGSLLDKEDGGLSSKIEAHRDKIKEAIRKLQRKGGANREREVMEERSKVRGYKPGTLGRTYLPREAMGCEETSQSYVDNLSGKGKRNLGLTTSPPIAGNRDYGKRVGDYGKMCLGSYWQQESTHHEIAGGEQLEQD